MMMASCLKDLWTGDSPGFGLKKCIAFKDAEGLLFREFKGIRKLVEGFFHTTNVTNYTRLSESE